MQQRFVLRDRRVARERKGGKGKRRRRKEEDCVRPSSETERGGGGGTDVGRGEFLQLSLPRNCGTCCLCPTTVCTACQGACGGGGAALWKEGGRGQKSAGGRERRKQKSQLTTGGTHRRAGGRADPTQRGEGNNMSSYTVAFVSLHTFWNVERRLAFWGGSENADGQGGEHWSV